MNQNNDKPVPKYISWNLESNVKSTIRRIEEFTKLFEYSFAVFS